MDQIALQVEKEKGIDRVKFTHLVEKKKTDLEGLVSDVGAAHIVANELGVQTLPKLKEPKVKELKPGSLGSITLDIRTVYPPKEFKTKDGRDGAVSTAIVADENGDTTRLVLWGRHSKLQESLGKGAKIRVINSYVKEGMKGLEIHVNKNTKITIVEKGKTTDKVPILQLQAGMFIKTRGSVTRILSERSFWSCPVCKYRGEECPEHGKTKEVPIVNALIDDGAGGVIRAVFFDERARQVALGEEKYFIGKVQLNSFSGNNELSVYRTEDVDVEQEVNEILGELSLN